MEDFLMPYDKEYMRIAMMKHEETFREQVHELHRLYRIQKALMKNVEATGRELVHQDRWNVKNEIYFAQVSHCDQDEQKKLDLEQPVESERIRVFQIINESEIELTLGHPSYRERKKGTEMQLTNSDSGPSFSSSSTGSSHIINKACQKNGSKIRSEQMIHQPAPWLFQVLSLNVT